MKDREAWRVTVHGVAKSDVIQQLNSNKNIKTQMPFGALQPDQMLQAQLNHII